MISVVKVKYDEVAADGPARLFKSDSPGLADGAQARDFIWVGDVVEVYAMAARAPGVSGLFNLGTGRALDLSGPGPCGLPAAGKPRKVEFINMPKKPDRAVSVLHPGADGSSAGGRLPGPVHPAREGVRRYVQDHLAMPPVRVIVCSRSCCFPQIDPVIVQLGPFAVRWYALAYIVSLVLGWRLVRGLVRLPPGGRHAVPG